MGNDKITRALSVQTLHILRSLELKSTILLVAIKYHYCDGVLTLISVSMRNCFMEIAGVILIRMIELH